LKYIILDLDGTIALGGERQIFYWTEPRNWKAAVAGIIYDDVIQPTKKLIELFIADGYSIIVLTARPANCRNNCISWLERVGIPWVDMYLRHDDDDREDYVIKEEFLKEMIDKYGMPEFALEDQPEVTRMFARNGVFTFGINRPIGPHP
jgi:hypothetical protein